jgi:hypothetical protein
VEGVRRVLYRLPDLRRAEFVYIVEGEKDADNLRAIGLTATCNPGGASKWRPENADSFQPHQRIVIIPDNEEAGRGRLEWESEPIKGVDADSVLSMSLTLAERENCQNVDKFLRKLLDSGPVASTKVYQDARQNGFSESTVNRAKRRLGIDAMKTGQPGETDQKWYRVLPKIVTKAVNAQNVTTFEARYLIPLTVAEIRRLHGLRAIGRPGGSMEIMHRKVI